jgi:hypothetical protein
MLNDNGVSKSETQKEWVHQTVRYQGYLFLIGNALRALVFPPSAFSVEELDAIEAWAKTSLNLKVEKNRKL